MVIFLGDHGPPFSRGKTTCYEAGLRVPFLIDWPGVTVPHVSKRLVSAVDIAPTVFDAVDVRSPTTVHGKSRRAVATILPSESNSESWRETLVGEFHFHGAGSFHPTRAITDGRYKLIHRLPGSVGKPIVSVDGDRSNSEREKLLPTAPCQAVYQRLQDPPTWELYDLQVDPYEFNNRSKDEAFGEVEANLRSALSQWQKSTSDPFREQSFCAEISQRYVK